MSNLRLAKNNPPALFWGLILTGFAYAAYFVLRYGGLWSENDTAVFTSVTSHMLVHQSVLFPGQYTHGFGYPAWLGSLSLLTGISVPVMNTIVMPFIGMLLFIITAYITYRTFLKSEKLGALTVLVMFATPDVMFTILRGNHEKLNIALMLWAFVMMIKAFGSIKNGLLRNSAVWIGLFYLFALVNATVNDYFASIFAFVITLTFVGGWLLVKLKVPGTLRYHTQILHLASYVLGSWLLVLWIMIYIFPPAGQDFTLAHGAFNKLIALILTRHASSNPYAAPVQEWAGKTDQFLVESFRWLLSGVSMAIWLSKLWKIIWRKEPVSFEHLFLVALYGAFGFLVALAIPLDFTGMNAGTNLEVRNFPYYALMAAPVMVWGILPALQRLKAAPRLWISAFSALLLMGFVLIGLLKSTLDPAISNQWLFYTPAERQALTEFGKHSQSTMIWTGPDNRLPHAFQMWHPRNSGNNAVTGYSFTTGDRDLLISPEVIANSLVQNKPVPPYLNQNRIYDNGQAQIYRVRPHTLLED